MHEVAIFLAYSDIVLPLDIRGVIGPSEAVLRYSNKTRVV